MSAIQNISRRHFLGGLVSAGAFVLVAKVLPEDAWAQTPVFRTHAESAPLHPTIFLGIEPDGTTFIVTHRSEMGTGIRTSLPLVAADELDADWSRVRIEQGIGDKRYGDQNTDGSRSMRDFYQTFRVAGASARAMLVSAAAAQWNVPASELRTENHEVIHQASGHRASYGSLVPAAATLPVPDPKTLRFKPKSAWKFVGKERPIYDLHDIVTGKAQFGNDIVLDNMLYASIEHPPVVGGTVKSMDDAAARAVKGVRGTATIPPLTYPYLFKPLGGVAVLGDNTWAVFQGRKKLQIEWNDGPNGTFDSEPFKAELLQTVRKPGKRARNLGDVDAEFAKGGTVVEAAYFGPMAAHAAMEPLAATAQWNNGKVTVWTPTQNPQAVQDTVAQAVGIKSEDVECHVTLLGGAFGRKSKPDYCAEAAILSKQMNGRPVKVVWTREDDMHHDYYHSGGAVYHKATLDAKGHPTAWLMRSAFPPIATMFDPNARNGAGFELDMGLTDLPFDVANIRAENGDAQAHVRIGWFRAVCNNFHAFAAHSFADELAHAAGQDPLEYLLALIGPGKIVDLKAQGVNYSNYGASLDTYPVDTRRLRGVLEMAKAQSGWGKRKPGNGWGMGVAAHRSFATYVASVVEVQVDKSGRVRIPHVQQFVDCGTVVNPDRVRAQFEGAAVMAMSLAMFGEVTAVNGRIQQSNFNTFRVARMNEAPVRTDVHFVENDLPPSGAGEPGVPPVIAALCNAIYAATGTRVRELPIARAKLV